MLVAKDGGAIKPEAEVSSAAGRGGRNGEGGKLKLSQTMRLELSRLVSRPGDANLL